MRQRLTPMAILLAAIIAQGCSTDHSQPAQLRDHAAAVCFGDPAAVVSVRADGRYALDFGVFDSAQLVRALNELLPPRPDKVVMVRTGSGRDGALRWIIPAIARAGGAAYQFDEACLHPMSIADRLFR